VVSPFHHPSTVEFFRLSIASSPKKFKVFFSPNLPSIDVDVQICLGVPKCPHFAPRFVLLLSVSITKKVIDMKNSYTCCGDIYDKIFVEMLMCIVGNRGDFFFFSTSDSTTLFCGVLEIPIFGSLYVSFFSCTSTVDLVEDLGQLLG